MTSRPARLRPALPQHWVQAVDERAADSGTPTSARSIPEAFTATGTQLSQPSSGRDLEQGSTDVASVHDRPVASVPGGRSLPSAQPEHATAGAEAVQPTTSDTEAVEQPAAVETGPPPRDTNVNEGPVNMAGQSESRDAVKVQQEAAQNPQGWQHAGLGGSVAPATPQAANAEPPQPVPEAMLQSQLTGQDALPKDQSAGTAHAVTDHAVPDHAVPAEHSNWVATQPGSSSPTAPVVDAAAARTQSRAPATAEAAGNPYSSYPPEAPTPVSAPGTAELHTTDSSAANRGATQPLGQGNTTAQPEASVTQATPPAADETSGARNSTSSAAARSQPQSAAMLSLEAMIPPPFELSSSPDSERLSAYAKPAATSTPAQSAFQSAAISDSTFGSQPQSGVQYMPAEAVTQGLNNKGAVSGSRPLLRASAPPPAGDNSSGSEYSSSQSKQMRLNSPEVQRQIEQTAAEVQEAVNERGGRQNLSGGGTQEGEALARATGTLKALVAGHVEEAESLSRGLPAHSGEPSILTQLWLDNMTTPAAALS